MSFIEELEHKKALKHKKVQAIYLRKLLEDVNKDIQKLEKIDDHRYLIASNELLRSAHAIASRSGVDTNWSAFLKNVERELVVQASSISGVSNVASATCTAKTYKLLNL